MNMNTEYFGEIIIKFMVLHDFAILITFLIFAGGLKGSS